MLLPMAMVTARSILFFMATKIAVECSAALPMVATTMTPTKTLFMPRESAAALTEPTRNSLMTATAAVAATSTRIAVRRRHSGSC